MLELVKILASILGGGLAGALINELLRRRREKVQRVQLIERVNRPVGALEGFTLVRVINGAPALKEVKDLREYQLTMRNSTSTHLQNAQIQFEFPSDDVQALVSVPALSRIPLVSQYVPMTPGKKVFRWTMPHFPAGDSVEFTFRAVAPSSEKYEYSLNYVGVIFERIVGEPPPTKSGFSVSVVGTTIGIAVTVLGIGFATAFIMQQTSGEKLNVVNLAGCDLQIASLFEVNIQRLNSLFHVKQQLLNIGVRDCVIQSQALSLENPTIIKSGDTLDRETLSTRPPKQFSAVVSVGAVGTPRETTTITVYGVQ